MSLLGCVVPLKHDPVRPRQSSARGGTWQPRRPEPGWRAPPAGGLRRSGNRPSGGGRTTAGPAVQFRCELAGRCAATCPNCDRARPQRAAAAYRWIRSSDGRRDRLRGHHRVSDPAGARCTTASPSASSSLSSGSRAAPSSAVAAARTPRRRCSCSCSSSSSSARPRWSACSPMGPAIPRGLPGRQRGRSATARPLERAWWPRHRAGGAGRGIGARWRIDRLSGIVLNEFGVVAFCLLAAVRPATSGEQRAGRTAGRRAGADPRRASAGRRARRTPTPRPRDARRARPTRFPAWCSTSKAPACSPSETARSRSWRRHRPGPPTGQDRPGGGTTRDRHAPRRRTPRPGTPGRPGRRLRERQRCAVQLDGHR